MANPSIGSSVSTSGAVRYTERFRLDQTVTADVLRQALAAIAWDLLKLDECVKFAEAAQASEILASKLGTPLERRGTPDALVGMGARSRISPP